MEERNELQRTRLLAADKSNQRIARLGAANRAEAVVRVRQLGLIPDTPRRPGTTFG